MIDHLSEQVIKDMLEKRISGSDLLALDDHLVACPPCADAVAAAAGASDEVNIDVTSPHLSFEALESYTNDTLEKVERELADIHLQQCRLCTAEIDELLKLRNDLSSAEAPVPADAERPWLPAILRPAFLVPAFGIMAAVSILIWWPASENVIEVSEVAVDGNEVSPPLNQSDNSVTNYVPPANSSTTDVVTEIRDGKSSIIFYADGRVEGISGSAAESLIRNALSKQHIDIPADVKRLAGASGVLMSGESMGVPFALTSPLGKVVESRRPTLSWNQLAGAESYRVEIFDESFSPVTSSPDISTTTWQPKNPLPRGRIYVWQVTAVKDGVESRSPVRPAPDAKFKVVEGAKLETIVSARRSGSKLALGLAYAEAGMLPEAERELSGLSEANPGNEAIAKLLQRIRAAR